MATVHEVYRRRLADSHGDRAVARAATIEWSNMYWHGGDEVAVDAAVAECEAEDARWAATVAASAAAFAAEREQYVAIGLSLTVEQVVDLDPGTGRFTAEACAEEPLLRAMLHLTEARAEEYGRTGHATTTHAAFQRVWVHWTARLEETGRDGHWGRVPGPPQLTMPHARHIPGDGAWDGVFCS